MVSIAIAVQWLLVQAAVSPLWSEAAALVLVPVMVDQIELKSVGWKINIIKDYTRWNVNLVTVAMQQSNKINLNPCILFL